jgi:hypothetical protein
MPRRAQVISDIHRTHRGAATGVLWAMIRAAKWAILWVWPRPPHRDSGPPGTVPGAQETLSTASPYGKYFLGPINIRARPDRTRQVAWLAPSAWTAALWGSGLWAALRLDCWSAARPGRAPHLPRSGSFLTRRLGARRPRPSCDARRRYHAFGLIGTALSKKIGVFQSRSLKVVPISPNAS